MLRIRAQGPAALRECLAGRDHSLWGMPLLDPTHEGLEQIETIERRRAAATVAHPRHEKQPAPPRDRLEAAVVLGELFVIAHGLLCGEPGIAHTVEEDEFAAVPGERVELGPGGSISDRYISRGGEPRLLVDIHPGRRNGTAHGARSRVEKTGDALRVGNAGIEPEARVDGVAMRILRARESLRQRRGLFRQQTRRSLRAFAGELGGIEPATLRIEDHPVGDAVVGIASLQDRVDDELAVTVRQGARGLRSALVILRRNLVERNRDPLVCQVGVGSPHSRGAGNDAIEEIRIPLGHQHRLAPTGRASHEVRVRRCAPVVSQHDLFANLGDLADGLI